MNQRQCKDMEASVHSANRVFVSDDSVIINVYEGDQDPVSIESVSRRTIEHIRHMQDVGRPVYILADLSHMGKTTAEARRVAVETLKAVPYDKVALYGASFYMKHLANLIITASGKGADIRYFDTELDARAWLLGENSDKVKSSVVKNRES